MVKVIIALLFWLTVALIQKFNWDLGFAKALVLFAVLAAVPFVLRAAQRRQFDRDRPPGRVIAVILIALFCVQGAYALKELRHPSLLDAATTTLAAHDALRDGINPYAAEIDASGAALGQDPRFGGYKYLPLTLAVYWPLGSTLGERGIVLTNLLLHLAVVWLIFRLGAKMATREAGALAALLYLSLPLVPFQLFAKGATDLVAIVPMLAALLLVERNAALAGFCLGLSISAKLLPGALLLPCCLPATRRARLAYGAGVVIGLLPILPFAIAAPQALFDNIVLFNGIRPADTTSWLFWAPPFAAQMAKGVVIALYVAVALYVLRHPPVLAMRVALGIGLILVAILLGPVAHHNYQLWWLPLGAALLVVPLAPARRVVA